MDNTAMNATMHTDNATRIDGGTIVAPTLYPPFTLCQDCKFWGGLIVKEWPGWNECKRPYVENARFHLMGWEVAGLLAAPDFGCVDGEPK